MKAIWFKRKRYGWGWTPATWQGWLVVAVYLTLIIVLGLAVDAESPREVMLGFFLPFFILTTALVHISYKKGEKPKWQWGNKRTRSSEPAER